MHGKQPRWFAAGEGKKWTYRKERKGRQRANVDSVTGRISVKTHILLRISQASFALFAASQCPTILPGEMPVAIVTSVSALVFTGISSSG